MARVFNVPRFSHESARIDNQNLYCKANHRTQCGCLAELGYQERECVGNESLPLLQV